MQLEAVSQRDSLVVLGYLNAVMRKSVAAPYVTYRENASTDTLMDLVHRHDLISANTIFRKKQFKLATFAGCKKRKGSANGKFATTRLAQLDHILLRLRERRRIVDCDTVTPSQSDLTTSCCIAN